MVALEASADLSRYATDLAVSAKKPVQDDLDSMQSDARTHPYLFSTHRYEHIQDGLSDLGNSRGTVGHREP